MRRLALTRLFSLPSQLVAVATNDTELLDWLAERVPMASADVPPARSFSITNGGDGEYELAESGRNGPFRGTRGDVALRLLERFNELACFTSTPLTVHSGLVADDAGRSIWIPAESGAGKSTLTAQLALRGLRYGTDEVVTIDDEGRLTGWAKWLSVKPGSQDVLEALRPHSTDLAGGRRRWMVPHAFAGAVLERSVDPFLIVLPTFDDAAPATVVETVPRAAAVASIAPQAFNLPAHGAPGFELLASVVRRACACIRITYGDGWDASDVLVEVLRSVAVGAETG